MPDPIDELENFSLTGTPMNPLPAAEVRRRGNRIRRRNNALATVGALAVVAAVATPFAVAAGGGDDDSIQPAGTVHWITTIPDGLGLDEGLPGAEAQDDYARRAVEVCEGAGWSPEAGVRPVDVEQVVQTESEGGWERSLALYPDEQTAEETLASARDRVQQCAASTAGKSRSTELVDSDGQRLAYVDHLSEAGDAYVNRIVQVGNALLVDTAYSFGTGDPQVVADAIANIDARSSGLVSRMCVFSSEGCPTEQPSEAVDEPTGLTGVIADDFPLEVGLPTSVAGGVGLEGISHDLDIAPYNVENTVQAWWAAPTGRPEPVDTLYAGYRSAAEGILRQLMTFDSVEDAQAYVDGTIAPFAACPEDSDNRGVSKVYEVTNPSLGDATAVSVMRVEVDGEPGIGWQVVQLSRSARPCSSRS